MTNIVVTNHSTAVSDDQARLMSRAVAQQLKLDVAPLWGLAPVPVQFMPKSVVASAPPGSWVISILDDADQADDVGWHAEDQGELIYGRVFAKPVLDNDGDVLSKRLSVASVLSHEVLETFVDPHANLWADAGDGSAYSYEICDPVEPLTYPVSLDSVDVTVSNFVTRSWFDRKAKENARLDFLRKCSAPFQPVSGGYVMILENGKVRQHFGERYPAWRQATKDVDTSRSGHRLSVHEGSRRSR